MKKREDDIYFIMCLSARIEAVIEKLEQKGLLTKAEIEKREVEMIKENLEKMSGKNV